MIKALILTGGKSTRMGTDKFLMEVNGKPQYQHLYELLTGLGLETYLSCSAEQVKKLHGSVPLIKDIHDGIGPIGGLAAAITAFPDTSWLVVACDLIHFEVETVNELLRADDENYDVITYQQEGSSFFETTCTLYHPSAYIVIRRNIRNGDYSLQSVLKKSMVKTIVPSNPQWLKNANSREDLNS
ncbi:molybdenum cofactor guanylyltransferase [Marinoscillum furvescens]|uniref:Molybdenum cofactor guanylyltransferase n=1 Tax=Marinoscillum furvescens DSM 4134 TaxID=1122208 RepID=A0A3D9LHX8_MARFU|nr:molybdenum cofactor guanylyltransferase [Marinoscillum furvescens]REE05629.1 molybdenum cofactor guanylyltransferase [Marinoscillum furvescens DSM 4134]